MFHIVPSFRGRRGLLSDNWNQWLDCCAPEWAKNDRRLPAVDIRETNEAYVLEAELPGVGEKDVSINADAGTLTISAKQEGERDERKENYSLRERRFASFERQFTLPDHVDRDGITATFKDGLLTLSIPKKEETKPRVIEVTTG